MTPHSITYDPKVTSLNTRLRARTSRPPVLMDQPGYVERLVDTCRRVVRPTQLRRETRAGETPALPGLLRSGFGIIAVLAFLFSAASALRAAEEQKLSHPNSAEAAKLDETSCADGFSFVIMGDSHTGHPVFETMRDAAIAMKPDFFVSVGDVTDNGKIEEYEAYIGQIEKARVPWFTAPGNHEYRSPQGHTSAEGQARFKRIFGKPDFSFTHCGWKFIIIDIVAYDSLMPQQLKRVRDELKGFEGRAVVMMHYPPAVLEKWKEGYWTTNGKDFLKALEDNKVPYFFSGHIHAFDRLKIGPTTYIVTGGGGGGVDSDRPKDTYYSPAAGAYHHFMYITVDPSGKASDFIVLPDEDGEKH